MRMRKSFLMSGVLAVTLPMLSGGLFCQGAPTANDLKAAGQLYKSKCSLCHSDDGSGTAGAGKALGAKDLRSQEVQSLSDDDLAATIKKGKNKMPAFGSLSDAQIKSLVMQVRHFAAK